MTGRPISVLALPHNIRVALTDNGYLAVEDLENVTAGELSLELGISPDQAEEVLRQAESYCAGPSRAPSPSRATQLHSATAAALLRSQSSLRFSTLSVALDDLLTHLAPPQALRPATELNVKGKQRRQPTADDGPVELGMVLEVLGGPGSGKTCVLLGIALSARLLGLQRNGGETNCNQDAPSRDDPPEVLLIDTEGSIASEHILDAAESLVEGTALSPMTVLDGMHLIRITTQIQMIAWLNTLDMWLEEHPKVKLLIIDSLSYHFRHPTIEAGLRKRLMDLVKQEIGKAATLRGCAVVVSSQMSTKLFTTENKPAKFETGDRAVLMPQLGDAWTTERTIRLTLFRGHTAGDDLRYAHACAISAASSQPMTESTPWTTFDIDYLGVPCDVPPPQENPEEAADDQDM